MRRSAWLRAWPGSLPRAGVLGVALALVLGCGADVRDEQAEAVCRAVDEARFEDALALSSEGASARGAGRAIAECRCIAQLSTGDRDGCTTLLGPLLARDEAADWVPHPVLTKLILRTWSVEGPHAAAVELAVRAAERFREDVDLLQLELMLRSRVEDETDLLRSLETRLAADDPEALAQRLVLALAWTRRASPPDALRVLGETPPPIDHPLALPWYESRIQAQAKAGDLAGVQATFARWREAGWDPIDLDARYALRLSVDHLRDPARDTVALLEAAIERQASLRDRQVAWALHRRLIVELLASGQPERALAAYDRAVAVVPLEGITRDELERAVRRASAPTTATGGAQAIVRLHAPPEASGADFRIAPGPDAPPDAGYRPRPADPAAPVLVETGVGAHPLRWVLRDAAGRTRGSGAVWPEAGAVIDVEARWGAAIPAARTTSAGRLPGDGRRRVFAILPDCGDWRLVEYLRARGELPFHDRLFTEGHYAILESRPAFTAAAMQALVWPSAREQRPDALEWLHRFGLELAGLESVGRNPVGFLSWVLPERPNLFETLGDGPIATANMLLAHGRIEAGRHAELVGPHGQRRALPTQNAIRPLDAATLARLPALHADATTRRHAETIAAEMDAAERIAREGEVDFLFLRLEALDLITHAHFAPLDGAGQDDGEGPLLDAYRYIDERLGALDALLDEDDWLVVLSDHGIRSSMEHEEDAIFAVLGAGVPAGRAPGRPALRGVPRAFAAMFDVETRWPDTGAAPWLVDEALADRGAPPRADSRR